MSLGLLTIPLELREHIFEFALVHERPHPTDVDSERPNRSAELSEDVLTGLEAWRIAPFPLRLEAAACTPNSTALFLINHQIYHEMRRLCAIRRFPWALDILIVDEKEMWPTWTCIPHLSQIVDTVNVTIRIASTGPPPQPHRRLSVFITRFPPRMLCAFHLLLELFLHRGHAAFSQEAAIPATDEESAATDKRIAIRALMLDFIPNDTDTLPPLSDLRSFIAAERADEGYKHWMSRNLPPVKMRIEWLALFFREHLEELLSDPWYSRPGLSIYQRVGSISICVGGSPSLATIAMADVIEHLIRTPIQPECPAYAITVSNRVKAALEFRRGAGLPCPDREGLPS